MTVWGSGHWTGAAWKRSESLMEIVVGVAGKSPSSLGTMGVFGQVW